jgi:hypothetical protein
MRGGVHNLDSMNAFNTSKKWIEKTGLEHIDDQMATVLNLSSRQSIAKSHELVNSNEENGALTPSSPVSGVRLG